MIFQSEAPLKALRNVTLKNHRICQKNWQKKEEKSCSTCLNRDRSTRFEVSPRLKIFFRVMSFGTSWDEKLCKQNLFTMLTY